MARCHLTKARKRKMRNAGRSQTTPLATRIRYGRWRCANRCGAGEWGDIPDACPACGAGVDVEVEY